MKRIDFVKIKKLELIAKKNVIGYLTGNYLATFSGSGLIYKESRKYYEGDPVRWIDWNLTAKYNEPFVKVFHDEREREVFLAIDISSSMFVGFVRKSKIEFAFELASTLGYSAVKNSDRLGFLFFSDKIHYVQQPLKSKKVFFHFLYKCIQIPKQKYSKESDIRLAIHQIQKFKGRRFIIFIISDFIDYDLPEDLKYLKMGNDLNLFHIYDPIEYDTQLNLRFFGFSPEGKQISKWIKNKNSLMEKEFHLKNLSLKYNIDFFSFSTEDIISNKLLHFFYQKRKRNL